MLSGRRKGTLTYSSIYINCISFSHDCTKLLLAALQKFRGGNQQYHGPLYTTFQTIRMTFSELKIISSINDQSSLSKGKHLCRLKSFEDTSPLTPIKSMIYGTVLESCLCGHSPDNLRYVNFLPEVLTISLKALWCTWHLLSPPVLLSEAQHLVWRILCAQMLCPKRGCECMEGCVSTLCMGWPWDSVSWGLTDNFWLFKHIFICCPSCWWKDEVNDWRQQPSVTEGFSRRPQADSCILALCCLLFTHRPNVN